MTNEWGGQRRQRPGTGRQGRRGVNSIELTVVLSCVLILVAVVVGTLGTSARGAFDRFNQLTSGHEPRAAENLESPIRFTREPFIVQLSHEWAARPLPWVSFGLAMLANLLFWRLLILKSRHNVDQKLGKDSELATQTESDIFEKRQLLLRILAANSQTVVEGKLEVRHAMTSSPPTVEPHTPVREACRLMKERALRHLLVCGPNDELCGLLHFSQLSASSNQACSQVMVRDPQTVTPDANLMQALTILIQGPTSCLPVVRDGHVHGVLTASDAVLLSQALLQFLTKISDRLKPALEGHRGMTITAHAQLQQSNDLELEPALP